MKSIKYYLICITFSGLLFFSSESQAQTPTILNIAEGFMAPPDSIKPYVYWYWINDHVSSEGVVKDLEAMQRVGIGGAFIGNIGLTKEEGTSYGDVKIFSSKWWEAIETAMETAGNLDITLGMFNSPGWSQSGGPWVNAESSMRYIASKADYIEGGKRISRKVKTSGVDSNYLFTMAFPSTKNSQFNILKYKPILTSQPELKKINTLIDGKLREAVNIPNENGVFTLDITFPELFFAQSLIIHPSEQPFSATITIQALQNNEFETVYVSDFNRSNTSLQTGFDPQAVLSLSIPSTKSLSYRVIFTNILGQMSFSEISLSPNEVLDHFMEKQLAKMYSTPLPLWDAYRWKEQTESLSQNNTLDPSQVLNISEFVDSDGRLVWNAPRGKWSLIHYYAVPTGVSNHPASPEGTGLEIDKMDAEKLPLHFDSFIGRVLKRIPEDKRQTFKYMVADSYEVGSQNWTDHFQKKFKEVYNYDPLPYLPVLSGVVVGSVDQSNRFLWDLRRLVADLVATEYVGGLRKLGNQHGLKLWLENYGHWGFPSEFLKYGGQSDEIAGEFWNEGDLGNVENKSASSAAHIYGKSRVWAESFTAGGSEYSRYPALLKRRGDWIFTEGVNQTLLHLYIHQLDEKNDPGINAWFSTEFNRKNTWFNASKGYIDYIRRCNYLLQQGNSVNEIAYFIGEDAPIITGTRQPELPKGYDYDYVNAEVIQWMYVKDGNLCLPSGASYRILVLPPLQKMRPEVLEKIKSLVADGAVILGSAPLSSPSLKDYPVVDEKIRQSAASLWGGQKVAEGIRQFGRGLVMEDISLESAMNHIGLNPDFETDVSEDVHYTHRSTPNYEIYFLTNQSEQKVKFNATFRVKDSTPYWFDAVTGKVHELYITSDSDKSIRIPITLDLNESGFVVFDKQKKSKSGLIGDNFPEPELIKEIKKPWDVNFLSINMQKKQDSLVMFDSLISWADHKDSRIRDFSGTAIYKNNIYLDNIDPKETLYLETGPIVGMAIVRVNGKVVGTLWTNPWRVDVSNVIRQGENEIEIEVVSTWKNRLIAESKLAPEERSLSVEINNYTPESPYDKSGLTRPVTISRILNIHSTEYSQN